MKQNNILSRWRDLATTPQLSWALVAVWAGVIFAFSALPTVPTPFYIWWDVLLKKTAHIVEYLILSLLMYRAFVVSGFSHRSAVYLTCSFAAVYAASDEWHQSFTPGRTPTVRDVFIDIVGISIALWIVSKQHLRHKLIALDWRTHTTTTKKGKHI